MRPRARRPTTWLAPWLAACLVVASVGAFAADPPAAAAPPPATATPLAPRAAARFPIADFAPGTPFAHQSAAGAVAFDALDVVRGARTLIVRSDGDGQQVNVRAPRVGPLDLSDAHLRVAVRVDDPDALEHALVYLSSDGFTSYATYRVLRGTGAGERFADAGAWVDVTIALGSPLTEVGAGVDLARVDAVQLSVSDRGTGPVEVAFGGLEAIARPPRGVVSIVFDDARDGVYTLARPLLETHGFRAATAVIAGLVGEAGFMTLDQLTRLERFGGWDVIAHQNTPLPDGPSLDRMDAATAQGHLDGVRAWLLAHGFRRGVDHLAYPFGGTDAPTIELVRPRYVSGRTIVRGLGHETWPPGDPYRIRALSFGPADDAATIAAEIDRAARDRTWLVLVFHQVLASAAEARALRAAGGAIDVATFRSIVAHLATADVDVRTLSELWAEPAVR